MTTAVTTEVLKVAEGKIWVVRINRPEAANSFDASVMRELTATFRKAATENGLRALVLTGAGKHFSAGADLNWMKDSAKLNYQENIADSKRLLEMFNAYEQLSIPTLAVVRGAAYGGAVGLIAASDIVIADKRATLCLSEARLGLLPAVIYPFLAKRVNHGSLKAWALTAKVLTAEEAKDIHLVDEVSDDCAASLQRSINLLLQCGPVAQAKIKELHALVQQQQVNIAEKSVQFIAEARTGAEAQAGLSAFFAKNRSPWFTELTENVSL